MDDSPSLALIAEQDRRLISVISEQRSRLSNFIRQGVPDPSDVEDIAQDVLSELAEANRLLMPIEHVTAWLFRVARNRITDFFRKNKPETFTDAFPPGENGESFRLEDILPSPDLGPDALYLRTLLIEELELALDDLPDDQRDVFIAHELEGRSFKDLAVETGTSINTLLSRKRYAVLHLRERLRTIHEELKQN